MEVVSKHTAEHYEWGEHCGGWHLVKSKNLSVIQERVPTGCGEVMHYHEKAEQFFYVLSGVATIELDSGFYVVNEHQGIHIPAGQPHRLSNQSDQDLHFIVTSTPPSHGDRIQS